MDGLLCRLWLGMEQETFRSNGRASKSRSTIGRICRIVRDLFVRFHQYVLGASRGVGGPWSAQDLEHVSISLLFFSGGLVSLPGRSEANDAYGDNAVRPDYRVAPHA